MSEPVVPRDEHRPQEIAYAFDDFEIASKNDPKPFPHQGPDALLAWQQRRNERRDELIRALIAGG